MNEFHKNEFIDKNRFFQAPSTNMFYILSILFYVSQIFGNNQTPTVNAPLPEDGLPYRLQIEVADFSLPYGLHSFVSATHHDEWLLLAGRTSGLHDVDNTNPNDQSFPVESQNTIVYVINPKTKTIYSRSLHESNLSQAQIDTLSVTNALSYQEKGSHTLYMVGGYGVDTATGVLGTKPVLTAIDIPGIIKWVKGKTSSLHHSIRQLDDPLLQVTGGVMWQVQAHQPYLLVFGQNYNGNYTTNLDGVYSEAVRPFQIIDTGHHLFVQPFNQPVPNPPFRRRDLNVVPIIKKHDKHLTQGFMALSGVFTPGGGDNPGAWTVPVEITQDGATFMPDPNDPTTFAQGMNNYSCANFGLYSPKRNEMYIVLLGGLSYLIVSDGTQASCTASPPINLGILTPCDNLPFVNDVTTIRIDSKGEYQQYLMSAKYPTITATFGSSPGGPIWFGSNATFFPEEDLPLYPNEVINIDKLKSSPVFLGYIVGGIASSVTDTNFPSDSQASTYIFKVTLVH